MPGRKTVQRYTVNYVEGNQNLFDEYVSENLKNYGGAITFDFATKNAHFFGNTRGGKSYGVNGKSFEILGQKL